MKKLMAALAILLVLALLASGGLWLSYRSVTTFNSVPNVVPEALGQPLPPTNFAWHSPVLGGLLYKDFMAPGNEPASQLGEFESPPALALHLPEGYDASLAVSRDGTQLYSGPAAGWDDTLAAEAGSYALALRLTLPRQDGNGYGWFYYEATFTVLSPPEPVPENPILAVGRSELQQGDIFTMQLQFLPQGITPTAQTDLGLSIFTQQPDGNWFCAVPVGNQRAPGNYTVSVTAADYQWELPVTVTAFEFDEQNLIIDVTDPVISEANSPEAYAEYRAKIPPLFDTFDTNIYWQGVFIQPVEGRISTPFGAIRYTNSDYSNPRYHYGLDIAAPEGTPIAAPNGGKVVLAEYLLNTGWTIAIEHGGGLKSYYFHMNEIHVEPGDMVALGDIIGAVGTTGYSTGPHLHFEMRIGNQPISPTMLFSGDAGLYSALQAPTIIEG